MMETLLAFSKSVESETSASPITKVLNSVCDKMQSVSTKSVLNLASAEKIQALQNS